MRPFFLSILLSMTTLAAHAQTLRLPAGATWMVTAPDAKKAAEGFAPLLKNTATRAASLSFAQVNFQIAQETGFRLLDASRLGDEGVDVSKGWALFDHGGVRYLGVFVKNQTAFDEAVRAWGRRRELPVRSDRKETNAITSTWSRTTGARPAMGYARRKDVAVVQLDPAGRSDALDEALAVWDSAVTIQSPVSGSLLLWRASWRGAKDVWTAFQPNAKGLDVFGTARQAADWFRRDSARAGWVAQATARSPVEVPVRFRATPAPRLIELIESIVFPVLQVDAPRDLPLTNALGVEAMSRKVDGDALKTSLKTGSIDWATVLSPELRVKLKKPAVERSFSTYVVKPDGDGAVVLPRGGELLSSPEAGTTGAFVCDGGQAVAGVRLDVAQASKSLLSIGLLSAMRNEVLLGVFGANAEYGFLMRASEPVSGLVCEDAKGRVTFKARWSFTPKG